jgi:hypothetical protein
MAQDAARPCPVQGYAQINHNGRVFTGLAVKDGDLIGFVRYHFDMSDYTINTRIYGYLWLDRLNCYFDRDGLLPVISAVVTHEEKIRKTNDFCDTQIIYDPANPPDCSGQTGTPEESEPGSGRHCSYQYMIVEAWDGSSYRKLYEGYGLVCT